MPVGEATTPLSPPTLPWPRVPIATPRMRSISLQAAGGARNIRWCVPAAANSPAIAACNSAMAQANTAAVSFSCVAGTDMAGCAELVGNGGAELTTQQGEQRRRVEQRGWCAVGARCTASTSLTSSC